MLKKTDNWQKVFYFFIVFFIISLSLCTSSDSENSDFQSSPSIQKKKITSKLPDSNSKKNRQRQSFQHSMIQAFSQETSTQNRLFFPFNFTELIKRVDEKKQVGKQLFLKIIELSKNLYEQKCAKQLTKKFFLHLYQFLAKLVPKLGSLILLKDLNLLSALFPLNYQPYVKVVRQLRKSITTEGSSQQKEIYLKEVNKQINRLRALFKRQHFSKKSITKQDIKMYSMLQNLGAKIKASRSFSNKVRCYIQLYFLDFIFFKYGYQLLMAHSQYIYGFHPFQGNVPAIPFPFRYRQEGQIGLIRSQKQIFGQKDQLFDLLQYNQLQAQQDQRQDKIYPNRIKLTVKLGAFQSVQSETTVKNKLQQQNSKRKKHEQPNYQHQQLLSVSNFQAKKHSPNFLKNALLNKKHSQQSSQNQKIKKKRKKKIKSDVFQKKKKQKLGILQQYPLPKIKIHQQAFPNNITFSFSNQSYSTLNNKLPQKSSLRNTPEQQNVRSFPKIGVQDQQEETLQQNNFQRTHFPVPSPSKHQLSKEYPQKRIPKNTDPQLTSQNPYNLAQKHQKHNKQSLKSKLNVQQSSSPQNPAKLMLQEGHYNPQNLLNPIPARAESPKNLQKDTSTTVPQFQNPSEGQTQLFPLQQIPGDYLQNLLLWDHHKNEFYLDHISQMNDTETEKEHHTQHQPHLSLLQQSAFDIFFPQKLLQQEQKWEKNQQQQINKNQISLKQMPMSLKVFKKSQTKQP